MGGSFSSNQKKPSKKQPPPISDVDRAVLDLKNARDRLTRYRSKLERDDAKLVERAKQAKADNKTSTALGLLRLRRYKQRELEAVEGQLLTVLQMVETIDSKQNEQEIIKAMSSGKEALQKMHKETTVDDVLELMDQIQEENEVERQISDILQGVPELSIDDEASVEAELEELQKSLQVELPTVPTTKLPEITAPVAAAKPAGKVEAKPARVALPS